MAEYKADEFFSAERRVTEKIVKYDCSTCENEYCTGAGYNGVTVNCAGYQHKRTNGDAIRAMTDEELAEWFGGSESFCPTGYSESLACDACPETCTAHWLDWLKQEVDNDD